MDIGRQKQMQRLENRNFISSVGFFGHPSVDFF